MLTENRILWAIDAFEPHPASMPAAVAFFDALARKRAIEVCPVFCSKPGSWPAGEKEARELLSLRLREIGERPWLREGAIVNSAGEGARAIARGILEYAKGHGFRALAVNTHPGMHHEFLSLGSVAEHLAFLADLPTLFIPADPRPSTEVRRIFIALNDAESAEELIGRFASLMPLREAVLRVHSYVTVPFPGYMSREEAAAYVEAKKSEWKVQERKLSEIASSHGARFELSIVEAQSLEERQITQDSEMEKSDLVVVIQPQRKILGQLAGHCTRAILREGHRPTLVMH